MLSDRKQKILNVVIDDYITHASPVSSKAIHSSHIENLSPATIRSELKSLEDLGYLSHPHTSAGRVPTELAYKHYIENVVKDTKMTAKELGELKKNFASNIKEAEYVASSAIKVLSEMTNYTSVATIQNKAEETISGVRLMKVSNSCIVLVIVSMSGKVSDHRIYGNFIEGEDFIKTAESVLNKHVSNRTVSDLTHLEEIVYVEFGVYKELFNQIFEALSFENKKQDRLLLMGESKIFEHPEYNNIQSVKEFMNTIECKDKLCDIINQGKEDNISINVQIGGDGVDLPKDCSLVTATYKIDDVDFGTYGVIGPLRMDYNKVIKILNGIRDVLSDIVK